MVAAFGLGLAALGGGALVLLLRRDREAVPREEQIYGDFGCAVVSCERVSGLP